METKVFWTIVVLAGPWLFLYVLALAGGGGDVGTVELLLLPLVWIIGLLAVWWPRGRPRKSDL